MSTSLKFVTLLALLSPSLLVHCAHLKCRTNKNHDDVFIVNESAMDVWKWWTYEGDYLFRLHNKFYSDKDREQVYHAKLECVPVDEKELAETECPECYSPGNQPEDVRRSGCLAVHEEKEFDRKWSECVLGWTISFGVPSGTCLKTEKESSFSREGNMCSSGGLSYLKRMKKESAEEIERIKKFIKKTEKLEEFFKFEDPVSETQTESVSTESSSSLRGSVVLE
uniref:Uncharacterized protein n=1 Tax=Chromera velia CCMP2878 TaxID=1169474 RepID=A0A0G4HEG1_9ALVE|eukprot:Cvel_968.t1-p1 / transcript=Cvel_968.t1 / gene=Cvel_968 / organism=Chromera_velia_CCMP2878 / gene_product=hypothetical protein / transcript_product=hypothetical protein / location=Cvel_scaffold31:99409-100077(+) / protein_length=223 / sequence_SO=supercontig / SO=protein_coding / is_pseudo=false